MVVEDDSPQSDTKTGKSKSKAEPIRDRSSTLDLAMERASVLKELANQKREDLRVGVEWNELFKKTENRADPDNFERFWAEIKTRLIRRFSTIQVAFKAIDNTGDGAISFLEFSHMLQQIHLPLDPRVCRAVFEQASGGDRSLSMEQLKKLLMEKTIRKLNFLMENFNGKQERVQSHIHHVLRRLAEANEVTQVRGVDRFQRKLTMPFCRDVWQTLLRQLRKSPAQHPNVERVALARVVHQWVGVRLQKYECSFILRIFDRIDCRKRGSISLTSFITQLVLLSTEQDNGQKIALMFEMFDTDYDGCLLYDQLLAMFRCICAQRPIAEESTRASEDLSFQEELSSQEGLRAYERCRWYLQRSCKVEGGIVSLRELWESLSMQPSVLGDLIPGVVRIRWAMEPSAIEETLESLPTVHHNERGSLRRSSTAPAPGILMHRERMSISRSNSKLAQALGRSGAHKASPGAVAAAFAASGRTRSNSKENDGTEAVQFKKSVMNKFQHSLRSFGEQRLFELAAGEVRPEIQLEDDCDSLAGSLRLGSPRSPRSPRGVLSGLSRVNTAPAGAFGVMAAKSAGSQPRTMSSHGSRQGTVPASSPRGSIDLPPIAVPMFNSDKWGAESADRFRLFCTVKNSFGKYSVDRAETTTGIGYRCQLCGHVHHLNVSCF